MTFLKRHEVATNSIKTMVFGLAIMLVIGLNNIQAEDKEWEID